MRLKRKWQVLLVSPIALVVGFYFFLLGANYYYATRAENLLREIRALKLDRSSVAELKRLGSKHGFRYDESPGDKCVDTSCLNMVFTNNRWMHSILRPLALTKLGERLGFRSWFAAGDIEIQKGQVIGKVYGIQFYAGSDYPTIEVAAWEEKSLRRNLCTYYPLKRHPGYAFGNASNIRSFSAETSEDAEPRNIDHAFQFNLTCLTTRRPCDKFSELMPAAWADYEDDGVWSQTHRSKLLWQVGEPCPY